MKTRIVDKTPIWALNAILLAGLIYSVLALTPTSAYASSHCFSNAECQEAQQDAQEICASSGSSLTAFRCNYPQIDYLYYECSNGNHGSISCAF